MKVTIENEATITLASSSAAEKGGHVAIYPGSFDPITNGHLDLIERGAKLVDRLIVSILRNDTKQPLFTVEERMEMLAEVAGRFSNVEVDYFDGLLVDYAARKNATVILRGIRAISDYEFELANGADESPPRARHRDDFSHGGGSVFVHQLPPGKGSLRTGRKHFRARATYGRGAASQKKGNMTGQLELAERISTISVSSTMKVAADAEKLRSQGVDVVDFGAGEPDFPTPDNIKQAAIRALDQNFTKYTAAGGTAELKQAICERHKSDFGTDYKPAECIVSVGGKHVIFNLTQAILNAGDEVIIPVPFWVTYKDVVNYAGGKCVFVNTDEENGFTITAAMIEAAVTPKTRMMIINSPSNP